MEQDNNGISTIQKLLNISLILQLSYFVLALLVNFLQRSFVEIFGYISVEQTVINWPGIIGNLVTVAMFLLLHTLFSHRLREDAICTSGFGILVIVGAFVMIYVIPSIASLLNNFIMLSKLSANVITAETFGASTALTRVVSLLNILYVSSIIMLLCAYAMYWFRAKYMPAQHNDL